MHPIASWMVTIDLHDEIELTRREDPPASLYAIQWHEEAVRKPEIDWPISSDLAARAHQALEEHVGSNSPPPQHPRGNALPPRRATLPTTRF